MGEFSTKDTGHKIYFSRERPLLGTASSHLQAASLPEHSLVLSSLQIDLKPRAVELYSDEEIVSSIRQPRI